LASEKVTRVDNKGINIDYDISNNSDASR